jgi:rhodanese-related sulfurtransferase
MEIGVKPYAGDISPQDAWRLLIADGRARLVDVRTAAEWSYVGVPDLGAAHGADGAPLAAPIFLEWQTWPTMAPVSDFVARLVERLEADGLGAADPVLFLCRSGARSLAAANALAAAGWLRAYNVAGGFEGPLDDRRHRGGTAGWKASDLPWAQG